MNSIGSILAGAGRIVVPLLIVGGAVGVFMAFGQKPAPARQEKAELTPLVETAVAEVFEGTFTLHADGVALPVRRMTLSAEVDGRVLSRSDQALGGRAVQVGTPLFEIDPTDHALVVKRLEAQLRQADEEVAAVDVDISGTQSLITIAEKTWEVQARALERTQKLATTDASTDGQIDQAMAAELTSRHALQLLRTQLSEATQRKRTKQAARDLVAVQLEEAQKDLERTSVTSPISGTVVSHKIEANDFAHRGDPLIELSDSSKVEVRCSLLVEQIYWIWLAAGRLTASEPSFLPPGDEGVQTARLKELELPRLPVRVLYDFGGGPVAWDGVLSRYEGTGLDTQTRAVPCRILIENPGAPVPAGNLEDFDLTRTPPRLFNGMFVDIEIPIDPPVELIRIPLSALRAGGQVWIVRDNVLHAESVDVAQTVDDYVLIRRPASLRAGDQVVTSPLAVVRDGMTVRLATQELPSTEVPE